MRDVMDEVIEEIGMLDEIDWASIGLFLFVLGVCLVANCVVRPAAWLMRRAA